VKGWGIDDFVNDNMLQSAVVLKLVVIGEEARKLPEEVAVAIDLPWRHIVGFRNLAVHEYFVLDLKQVWTTVQEDLPEMVQKLEAYLAG